MSISTSLGSRNERNGLRQASAKAEAARWLDLNYVRGTPRDKNFKPPELASEPQCQSFRLGTASGCR